MSDLAPFVAATIRDKVVQELLEENEKLRQAIAKEKKEKHDRLSHDAVCGFSKVYSIAVIGPSPADVLQDPVIYAIYHIRPSSVYDRSSDVYGYLKERNSACLRECTLGDLLTAQLCINGHRGPFDRFGIDLKFVFESGMLQCRATPRRKFVYVYLFITGFRDIGLLRIDLVDVPETKLFEFAGLNMDDYERYPRHVIDRPLYLTKMADFFGAETKVRWFDTDVIDS